MIISRALAKTVTWQMMMMIMLNVDDDEVDYVNDDDVDDVEVDYVNDDDVDEL